jgi:beta-galactosidase/beta-glucuronidase
MDENRKGIENQDTGETMRLSREFMYSGMAWYQKEIDIPEKWDGLNIRLIMERTKPTRVWVDSAPAGENSDILTQQVYDLSDLLTPGLHTITILVNNGRGSVPDGITGSHAWTEHTQTNWNGIIGKFCLEASNKSYIKELKTFPDPEAKKVTAKLVIFSAADAEETASVVMKAASWNTERPVHAKKKSFSITLKPGENEIELSYSLGDEIQLWSEFEPVLYKLEVVLKGDRTLDAVTKDFARCMRFPADRSSADGC